MYVNHNLKTIVLALIHNNIKNLHAVLESLTVLKNEILVDISVCAGRSNRTVLAYNVSRRIVGSLNGAYRVGSTVHPRNKKLS